MDSNMQLRNAYEQAQQMVRELESKYQEAKKEIENSNVYAVLDQVLLLTNQFQIGDSGDKAIALLAQLRLVMREMTKHFTIIQKYEQSVRVRNELSQHLKAS